VAVAGRQVVQCRQSFQHRCKALQAIQVVQVLDLMAVAVAVALQPSAVML
jgi:hypothetical protein